VLGSSSHRTAQAASNTAVVNYQEVQRDTVPQPIKKEFSTIPTIERLERELQYLDANIA
jgi:hypothetical protein